MYDTAVKSAIDDVATALNGVPASEIKAELDRILSSRVFVHSHRIRRFLQFVVEECLLGQHHRLKEYLIGLEVFNRREAFDPRVDSIVRVEARRLRAKLEEYYLTEGREDELRILLRKGSYIPVFEYRRDGSNSLGGFAPSHRRSIAITSFLVSNGGGDHMALVDEIKRRLAHVLIKEGYFRVLGTSQQPDATAEPRPDGSSNGATPELPKADYLLEGIVEIHDQRIRLILQLQNVIDGSCGWSESTECDFNNLSNIEALARAVNRELLTPRNEASRARIHGEHKQSYDSYLQGRYYWKLATPESVRSSVASFQKASESNPAYAAAWAALAEAMALSSMFGFVDPAEAGRMKEAAQKAAELHDSLPEAHLALGAALSISDWNWKEGELELQRAIQLDSRDHASHVAYAIQLACRGMIDDGILEVERALELDPASLFANFALGWLYSVGGRHDEAISQHRLVAQLAPDFPLSYLGLGWAHCGKRMYPDAIAHFTNASNLLKCRSLLRGCLGYCYAMSGRKDEALRELAVLKSQAQSQYTSPISSAAIYSGLGDKDRALSHLEQALASHDISLPVQLMSPEFDSLRQEPRFAALREKMGL
jgi:tetratricopeptide (TPR) repeat protein